LSSAVTVLTSTLVRVLSCASCRSGLASSNRVTRQGAGGIRDGSGASWAEEPEQVIVYGDERCLGYGKNHAQDNMVLFSKIIKLIP